MNEPSNFFKAVCAGDAEAVAAHLQHAPEMLHAKEDGATPLHFAAINNHCAVVDLLLEHGADINALDDEYGAPPCGWANEKGHGEMVQYLYSRGAQIDLNRAAAFGMIERVRALLDAGEPVDRLDGFGTPLHEAAVWGYPDIVQLLLARGAGAGLPNRDGQTALEIAQQQVESKGQGAPVVPAERRAEIVQGCAAVIEALRRSGE